VRINAQIEHEDRRRSSGWAEDKVGGGSTALEAGNIFGVDLLRTTHRKSDLNLLMSTSGHAIRLYRPNLFIKRVIVLLPTFLASHAHTLTIIPPTTLLFDPQVLDILR